MRIEEVILTDLGRMDYKQAWDMQESLLQSNVEIKTNNKSLEAGLAGGLLPAAKSTLNHLLFVEHEPVFTLGKSGHLENVLLTESELQRRDIAFYKINRGGDITFHGPGQLVGYPILDLEKFGTDIGKYLRNLEEVVILTLAAFGIRGERSAGETGVWINPQIQTKARKICAMGVRCSRWITMHGFALNVNTDLSYFDYIVPCGIKDKQVSSMQKELASPVPLAEVKQILGKNFERVFDCRLINEGLPLKESYPIR